MLVTNLPAIVLDTNLLVSAALLPGSASGRALEKALLHHELAFSDATWDELHEVLHRPKFDRYLIPAQRRTNYLHTLARTACWHHITTVVADCRDQKDNKFLELAHAAHAAMIVSGDSDLLCLHPWHGTPIVTPAAFLLESQRHIK